MPGVRRGAGGTLNTKIPYLRPAMRILHVCMAVSFVWLLVTLSQLVSFSKFAPAWVIVPSLVVSGVGLAVAIWFYFRARRLFRRAQSTDGAVCPGCTYTLPNDDAGTCPECGRPFTREENRQLWGVPKSRDNVT